MNHFHYFKNRVVDQMVYILFFMTFFSVLGYFIPKIYYMYFDKTIYYQVKLPIKTEKVVYHPCEYVKVSVERKSLVDLSAEAIIELRLIKEDGSGNREILNKENRKLTILKSKDDKFNVIGSYWYLPCKIYGGRYVFEGTVSYEVNGIKKYTPLQTEEFIVE